MNSRIVIAALSAVVMGVACLSPGASVAQTPTGQSKASARTAPSEAPASALQAVPPPNVKKSSISEAAEQPAGTKTGELLLEPAPMRK